MSNNNKLSWLDYAAAIGMVLLLIFAWWFAMRGSELVSGSEPKPPVNTTEGIKLPEPEYSGDETRPGYFPQPWPVCKDECID